MSVRLLESESLGKGWCKDGSNVSVMNLLVDNKMTSIARKYMWKG